MGQTDEIAKHEWDVEDSWSERDEEKKQSYYNDAAEALELQLQQARELVQDLYSHDVRSEAVIGQLVAIASSFSEEARKQALMEEDEVPDSIERISEEIDQALKLEYEFREDVQLSPSEVQKLSEEVNELGRAPARLQDLMRQKGSKIESVVSIAFAGTEVMTEGSSEEEAGLQGE
jgi:uncharacterized protein YoxC